jgi:hypothetical protein
VKLLTTRICTTHFNIIKSAFLHELWGKNCIFKCYGDEFQVSDEIWYRFWQTRTADLRVRCGVRLRNTWPWSRAGGAGCCSPLTRQNDLVRQLPEAQLVIDLFVRPFLTSSSCALHIRKLNGDAADWLKYMEWDEETRRPSAIHWTGKSTSKCYTSTQLRVLKCLQFCTEKEGAHYGGIALVRKYPACPLPHKLSDFLRSIYLYTPKYHKRYSDRLDGRGSCLGKGRDFSLLHRVQTGSRAHSAPHPVVTGGSFPGRKAARGWNLPLTSS